MAEHTHADHPWVEELPYAITVCDASGLITQMNSRAAEAFAEEGGRALIGQSLLGCHPERARAILEQLLATGRENIYSIEKEGRHKLIVQSPWYRDGQFAGLVELSIPLPEAIPHFNRDAP